LEIKFQKFFPGKKIGFSGRIFKNVVGNGFQKFFPCKKLGFLGEKIRFLSGVVVFKGVIY